MKEKRFEEIRIIPDTTMNKLKRYIAIQIIGIIVLGAIGIYMCIQSIKLAGEVNSLILENEELNKAIEMKDSMISDLQEDNIKLQEMIDNVKN